MIKYIPTYKALMLDVDGTIVISEKNALPTKKVIEAVHKASKLGIHVCLATGRPYASVKEIVKILKLTGLLSLLNGSQIVNASTGEVLVEKNLTIESLNKLLSIFNREKIKFLINDNSIDYDTPKNYKPDKPIAICTYGINKDLIKKLENEFSDIPDIDYHTFPAWESLGGGLGLAITHINATKQHGILEVARILGINTHEIIGIGDGYNDFPMMMACGLRVAMGNAVPELKEIADYICPTVENDGVADVIERYILSS